MEIKLKSRTITMCTAPSGIWIRAAYTPYHLLLWDECVGMRPDDMKAIRLYKDHCENPGLSDELVVKSLYARDYRVHTLVAAKVDILVFGEVLPPKIGITYLWR